MSANIILIYCSEDGDHSVRILPEERFLRDLNNGDYGDKPEFLSPGEVAKESDLNCLCGYIIIRGEIVQPKPVEVVKKYEL